MENCKEQFVRDLLIGSRRFLTKEEIDSLKTLVSDLLESYDIRRECRAMTTESVNPNSWYLDQFLAIKIIKGLSESTIRRYRADLTNFIMCVNKPIPEIEPNDIRYFLAIKARAGCKKVTLNNYLLSLRTFFETLFENDYIGKNPAARIDKIKEEKREKKPLSDLDIEKLRKYFKDSPREKAILEMLLSTGCRVSELVSIDVKDIDGDRIIVTGKGSKQRPVYINASARFALNEYLATRKDSAEALFVGKRFNSEKECIRLGKGTVEKIMREAGRELGIEHCHPHRFRRTMATNALRNGMPIEQVSRMLGHDQLTTTQIYAKSEDSDIELSHKKYVR